MAYSARCVRYGFGVRNETGQGADYDIYKIQPSIVWQASHVYLKFKQEFQRNLPEEAFQEAARFF